MNRFFYLLPSTAESPFSSLKLAICLKARRRCFSKFPSRYVDPLPLNSSLWNLPIDANVLRTHYKCKSFNSLTSKKTLGQRGFFKCSECFNLTNKWWELPANESISDEFTIDEVLSLKPGKIRIGLDFSPSTGTFAALMKARNVAIAIAILNLSSTMHWILFIRLCSWMAGSMSNCFSMCCLTGTEFFGRKVYSGFIDFSVQQMKSGA